MQMGAILTSTIAVALDPSITNAQWSRKRGRHAVNQGMRIAIWILLEPIFEHECVNFYVYVRTYMQIHTYVFVCICRRIVSKPLRPFWGDLKNVS